jgi:CxxC motif-containing protein (DUF1111 family)
VRRRLAGCAAIAAGCLAFGTAFAQTTPADGRLGGELSVSMRTSRAFSQPGPTLDAEARVRFARGDGAFDASFVAGAAPVNPGLGPRFNNASCQACHVGDGRGLPVVGGGPLRSMALVRVSQASGEPLPDIGFQIRDHATFGLQPDASVALSWQTLAGSYGDGTPYELREPRLEITLADGTLLAPEVLTSLRVGPPDFGRGLLEAVPDQAILALADADDADGDGISGRPNWIDGRLGRFGLKANTADLLEQVAAAFANDMGVSSPLAPEADGSTDVDQATLDDVTFYVRTLAVPVRRPLAAAERGAAVFAESGCAACHTPQLRTGPSDVPALAKQVIYPYSDLLLHDLGPGLADGRPDFAASGSEWRTAPLWGIGLTETVLGGNAAFLHDGRARTLAEAILWHAGEAEPARERFAHATADERAALIAFLRSL